MSGDKAVEGQLKGVRVLLLGPRFNYPETLAGYYETALRSLGATVGGLCTRTSRKFGEEGFTPDYAIFFKDDIRTEIALELKDIYKCKTILYWPDPIEDSTNIESREPLNRTNWEHLLGDPVKKNGARSFFDECFLAGWTAKEKLDELNARFLPVAYDPSIHFKEESKIETDVLFIGSFKRGREFIPQLRPAVSIWGNGWDEKTRDVYGAEKRALTCGAKVVLNQNHLQTGPNDRLYQIPACGAFMLSDRIPAMDAIGLVEGTHYGSYPLDNPRECESAIETYLMAEQTRKRMAEAAHEWVKDQTYEKRILEMLNRA